MKCEVVFMEGGYRCPGSNDVLVLGEGGDPSGYEVAGRDIDVGGRKKDRETSGQQQHFLRNVIDANPNLVFVKDWDGRFVLANEAVADIYGTTVEGLIGKTDADFGVDPEEVAASLKVNREVIETLRERHIPEEPITEMATGEVRWFQICKVPLVPPDGSARQLLVVATDITGRKKLEERLEHRAHHDQLTGAPNRTLFMERLGRTLTRLSRRQGLVAVLFLDLDDFKLVNDSLGHEVGDQMLLAVAGRLQACVRPQDTVARFGGDEFTVLLEDVRDAKEVDGVADRILEALHPSFCFQDKEALATASIGVALSRTSRENPEELVRKADVAMYRAKSARGPRYEVFHPAMDNNAPPRLNLETGLRRAIGNGEFSLRYRPRVEVDDSLQDRLRASRNPAIVKPAPMRTPRITAVEASLRWEHPQRGLLFPQDFIEVAEDTGMISPIGRWMLREACRQARVWRERHPTRAPLTMCVSLSTGQLQRGIVGDISRTLEDTRLEPAGLNLEIPEDAFGADAQPTATVLREIKELGVKITINNFGAGRSSLGNLRHIPADSLKIERSFVDRLGQTPGDTAIAGGIITLAHALGLKVVAEGVESDSQLARLRALGCDVVQGNFLYGELSSQDFSALLTNSR